MSIEKMGMFIAEQRKARQMTQKELAIKLNVSDKAVSKWERGLNCPDISLLSPLSDALGVAVTELLNGAKADAGPISAEDLVHGALAYGEKSAQRQTRLNRSVIAAAFSVLLLIGVFVVSVVDVSVSGAFSWSLLPISSCAFAWLVFFPAIKCAEKGIWLALLAFSVGIAPFLFAIDVVIDRLAGADALVFPVGVGIAPFPVALLWTAYLLVKRYKKRVLPVMAALALLASPISCLISVAIARMLGRSCAAAQMVMTALGPLLAAAILFAIDYARRAAMRRPSDARDR